MATLERGIDQCIDPETGKVDPNERTILMAHMALEWPKTHTDPLDHPGIDNGDYAEKMLGADTPDNRKKISQWMPPVRDYLLDTHDVVLKQYNRRYWIPMSKTNPSMVDGFLSKDQQAMQKDFELRRRELRSGVRQGYANSDTALWIALPDKDGNSQFFEFRATGMSVKTLPAGQSNDLNSDDGAGTAIAV